MHGIDWDQMYDEYLPKAKAAGNNHDFAIIASELLGELNASHTGARYRPAKPADANTASLGVLFDTTPGNRGLKVAEVLPYSPSAQTCGSGEGRFSSDSYRWRACKCF